MVAQPDAVRGQPRNFIFDFDGTIADSLHVVIDVANDIGGRIGLHVDPDQVDDYRKMSSLQVVRHFKLPVWRLPKLMKQGMREFEQRIPSIDTFPGLPEALAALQQRGDKLFMLTSNSDENVREFLRLRKLDGYFTGIYTDSSLFGKASHLKRIVREQGLVKHDTVYVGDETRDIQAARRATLKVVSVAWGFNHESILKKYRPTYLIHKPAELLKLP